MPVDEEPGAANAHETSPYPEAAFPAGPSPQQQPLLREGLTSLGRRLRACYASSLKHDPDMVGEVVLVVRLSAHGHPTRVQATASTPSLTKLLLCLKSVTRSHRFPPPEPGQEDLTIPIRFEPADDS